MRTSSSPAFRNLPAGQGGYATFDHGSGMAGGTAAYADSAPVGYGRAEAVSAHHRGRCRQQDRDHRGRRDRGG